MHPPNRDGSKPRGAQAKHAGAKGSPARYISNSPSGVIDESSKKTSPSTRSNLSWFATPKNNYRDTDRDATLFLHIPI
eukprot:1102695-Prorocentrum_minimum.AAC.1